MSTMNEITPDTVVFAFPGQGSNPCGALAGWYMQDVDLREKIDAILAIVDREATRHDPSITPGLIADVLLTQHQALPLPYGIAQLALYTASVVLDTLLKDAGIRPALIVAQSFGEIPARVSAGVFDIAQGARVVCALNAAYLAEHGLGGMVLVHASVEDTQALVEQLVELNLVLASVNAPNQCIVSAENADLEKLLLQKGKGIPTLRKVATMTYASHFPAHTRVAHELYNNLQCVPQGQPTVPIYSTVLGEQYALGVDLHKMLTLGVTQRTDLPKTLAQLPSDEHYFFVGMGVDASMCHCIRKSLHAPKTYSPLALPVGDLHKVLADPAHQPGAGASLQANSETDAVEALRRLVRGSISHEDRVHMETIFDDPAFLPRSSQTFEEGHELTYKRLRHLLKKLPDELHGFKRPELLMALAEQAAIADPSLFMGCVIQQGLCIGTLLAFEHGHPQASHWRRQLESGEQIGAYAITEIGVSNSHIGPQLEARFDPQSREFVLHTPGDGALKFANVGVHNLDKLGVVFARLMINDQFCGVFAFVLPLSNAQGPRPGIRMSSPAEIRSVPLDYGLLGFDKVRIPFFSWLSDGASIDLKDHFHDPLGSTERRLIRSLFAPKNVWAMVGIGLSSVMLACSTLALTHANRRTTQAKIGHGTRLLNFRTQQRALFGCLATGYVMRCFANDSARLWASNITSQTSPQTTGTGSAVWTPWVAISSTIALTKALCAPAAEAIATECRLRCGVAGALNLNRFFEYEGMAKIYQDAGGNNFMILLDAAKALIGQPLIEPALPDPQGALDNPAYWLAMLRTREYRLLKQVADHVSTHAVAGEDNLLLWNSQLMVTARAGEAHAQRLAMESAAAASATLQPGLARDLANALAAVHALEYLNKHAAWYMSSGLLDSARYQSFETQLDALSDFLSVNTPLLIDAFGYGEATHAAIAAADAYPTAFASKLKWAIG